MPFEADFLDYLRGLSFTERRAFDMAMGYVFGKISDLGIRLPKSGLYMFLKASEVPLGPFTMVTATAAICFARRLGFFLHRASVWTAPPAPTSMVDGMQLMICRQLLVGWATEPVFDSKRRRCRD